MISADEYLKFYQQHQAIVIAVADDGRRVRFPANLLQRFVMHDGIRGRFRIDFTPAGKCLNIDRV